MKKILVLLLIGTFCGVGFVYGATNWSKFESGTDNIRLDGYQGQPGYIKFTDGNGTNAGYLWACYDDAAGDYRLMYSTPDALDLNTTKLTNAYGVVIDLYD